MPVTQVAPTLFRPELDKPQIEITIWLLLRNEEGDGLVNHSLKFGIWMGRQAIACRLYPLANIRIPEHVGSGRRTGLPILVECGKVIILLELLIDKGQGMLAYRLQTRSPEAALDANRCMSYRCGTRLSLRTFLSLRRNWRSHLDAFLFVFLGVEMYGFSRKPYISTPRKTKNYPFIAPDVKPAVI